MPQLGAPELIIILVIIILIFGVGKLPEVGQALGKGIREFRGAASGGEEEETPPAKPAPPAVEPPRPAPAVEAPRPTPAVEAPRQPVAVDQRPAAAMTTYTVVEGDTLDTIAAKHGVTVEALMAANGYSRADRVLYAGDRIQVPTPPPSA